MAKDTSDKPLTLKGLVEYIGPIFQELKLANLGTKGSVETLRSEMRAGFAAVDVRFEKVEIDIQMLDRKIDSKVDVLEIKMNNKFEKQAVLIDDLKKDIKVIAKHEKRLTNLERKQKTTSF